MSRSLTNMFEVMARREAKKLNLAPAPAPTPALATAKPAKTTKPRTKPDPHMAQNFSELASFLWSVADLLRGDKRADFGKVNPLVSG